jgi:hypothetical protein
MGPIPFKVISPCMARVGADNLHVTTGPIGTSWGDTTMVRTTQQMQSCIEQCMRCHAVCLSSIQHCLGQGGRHVEQEHLQVMADCSQICATSADFMLRQSPRHTLTCNVCAEVCEACAQSCDQMRQDETMRRCADECRQCAVSCREMAGLA